MVCNFLPGVTMALVRQLGRVSVCLLVFCLFQCYHTASGLTEIRLKVFEERRSRRDANSHCKSDKGRLLQDSELDLIDVSDLDRDEQYWLSHRQPCFICWARCHVAYLWDNILQIGCVYCFKSRPYICYYEVNITTPFPTASETVTSTTVSSTAVSTEAYIGHTSGETTTITSVTSPTWATRSPASTDSQVGSTAAAETGATDAVISTGTSNKGAYIGAGIGCGLVTIIIIVIIVMVTNRRHRRCCFQQKPECYSAAFAQPTYEHSTTNGSTILNNQRGGAETLIPSKPIYDNSPSVSSNPTSERTPYKDEEQYNHIGDTKPAVMYDPSYSHLGQSRRDDDTDEGGEYNIATDANGASDYDIAGDTTRTKVLEDPSYSHLGQGKTDDDVVGDGGYCVAGDMTKILQHDASYSNLGQIRADDDNNDGSDNYNTAGDVKSAPVFSSDYDHLGQTSEEDKTLSSLSAQDTNTTEMNNRNDEKGDYEIAMTGVASGHPHSESDYYNFTSVTQ